MDVRVPVRERLRLGRVDGDLLIQNGGVVEVEGDELIVTGLVVCYGDAEIRGSVNAEAFEGRHGEEGFRFHGRGGRITVDGSLTVKDYVRVKGFLSVRGNLSSDETDAGGGLEVGGSVSSESIDVGGLLQVRNDVKATSVNAGGSIRIGGRAEADKVHVGGRIEVEGVSKIRSLDCGGKAEVGGGEVEDIDAGGGFESKGDLKFGRIDVGGVVTLKGKAEGERIDVGGKFEADGDLKVEEIDVGGTVRVDGSIEGGSVDVGGTVRVGRDLVLTRQMDVGGTVRIGGSGKMRNLDVGGSIEADWISVDDDADIGGEVLTKRGLKASRIELGRRGSAVGPLIGGTIRIGRDAEVEDVYAEYLDMEHDATARNLYFRRGRLARGCRIHGVVKYVESLEVDREVKFSEQPEKVQSLPPPPL